MLTPGTLLKDGRYSIIERIGQGGFGVVYQAQDLQKKQTVAIKELRVNDLQLSLDDPSVLRRAFEEEAKRLMNLSHPALPKGIDYFEENNRQYFAMEFIAGENFENKASHQHGQRFAVQQVLQWADQLLAVLIYLHGRVPPVIHRDIKPPNLKLKPDGQIVLLDFGIAKGGLTQYPQSTLTVLRGAHSQYFSSPEQIEGLPTDERSDLYSLAATLYWLLTNYWPDGVREREKAIKRGDSDLLTPANELNDDVPVTLAKVLTSGMAIDAKDRPRSAAEMRSMLSGLLEQAGNDGQRPIPRTQGGDDDSSSKDSSERGDRKDRKEHIKPPLVRSSADQIKLGASLIATVIIAITILQFLEKPPAVVDPPATQTAIAEASPIEASPTVNAPTATPMMAVVNINDSTYESVETESGRKQIKVMTHLSLQENSNLETSVIIELETRLPQGLLTTGSGSPEVEIREQSDHSETIVTQRVPLNNVDPMNVNFESIHIIDSPHHREPSYTIPVTTRLLSAQGTEIYRASQAIEVGPIAHEPALSISSSLSNTLVAISDTVSFNLTITNTGETWLDQLVIKPEKIPAEFNVEVNNWQSELNALGALEPGQCEQILLSAQVNTDQFGKLETTVLIAGVLGDGTEVEASSVPVQLELYAPGTTSAPPGYSEFHPLRGSPGVGSDENPTKASLSDKIAVAVLETEPADDLLWYLVEVITSDGQTIRGWLWSERIMLGPPMEPDD